MLVDVRGEHKSHSREWSERGGCTGGSPTSFRLSEDASFIWWGSLSACALLRSTQLSCRSEETHLKFTAGLVARAHH